MIEDKFKYVYTAEPDLDAFEDGEKQFYIGRLQQLLLIYPYPDAPTEGQYRIHQIWEQNFSAPNQREVPRAIENNMRRMMRVVG